MPQPDGLMWLLAGTFRARGVYEIDLANGSVVASASVSGSARAIAQSPAGMVGLALATPRTGALELIDGASGVPSQVVAIGAPAYGLAVGDRTTFYVLAGTASSTSATVVDVLDGKHATVREVVPLPIGTVSIAPSPGQGTLFALQPDGVVTVVSLPAGTVEARFTVGHSGIFLAPGPSGSTLYVLKGRGATRNVAVVELATESVRKVLPAPAGSEQIAVSADGRRIYDTTATRSSGNVQIFSV